MDLHHLRIFVNIYNKRSFSLASRELNISQPTISEHIKNFEAELGTPLFDRLPRTIIPTKAAEAIYPKAVHILEEAESIMEAVQSSSDNISGLLKVGSSTIPGTYIIPRAAGSFQKQHPGVSFEVIISDSSNITNKILNHELILGITGAITEKSKLNYIPFATDSLVLAAPYDYITESSISKEKLAELPIVMREDGSGTRKATEEHLTQSGIKPSDLNIVGILGSTSAVKEAVVSGLGASIFSKLSIENELKNRTFREIPVRGLEMKRHFYTVTHKRRQLSSPYSQFMESLLSKDT